MSSSSSSSSSDSDSSSEEETHFRKVSLFDEAMELRMKAKENGNKRLEDMYLMIAAAYEYSTLEPNYLQLCNLLFLNMLLIEAKICYKAMEDNEERRKAKKKYMKLTKRESKMREIVRQKL